MRAPISLLLVAAALGGCNPVKSPATSPGGRYVGVGLYDVGKMWKQIAGAPKGDEHAADLADDEYVIVVMDGHTGEIRQCGNLSGHCIGANPWSKPLASSQTLPASLASRAEQPAAETN